MAGLHASGGQTSTIIRTVQIDIELGQHRFKASSYALLGRCCFFRDAEGNVVLEHRLHEVPRKCFPYSKHRTYGKPLTLTFLNDQDLVIKRAGATDGRGKPVYQFHEENAYRQFQGDLRAKQLLYEIHIDSISTVKSRNGADAVNECVKLWQARAGSQDTTISFPALRNGVMKDFELPLKWFNSPRPVNSSAVARMELAQDQPAAAKQGSSSGSSIFSKPRSKHSSRVAQSNASTATPASVNTISGQSVFAPRQFIDEVGYLDIKFANHEELQTFMKAFEDAAAESGGRRDSISAARPALGAGDCAEVLSPDNMSVYTSSTAYTGSTAFTGSSIGSSQIPYRGRAPSMTEEVDEMDSALPPQAGGQKQRMVERLEQKQIPPKEKEAQRLLPALNLPPTTATGLVPRDAVMHEDEYSSSPSAASMMKRLTPSTLLGHHIGRRRGKAC